MLINENSFLYCLERKEYVYGVNSPSFVAELSECNIVEFVKGVDDCDGDVFVLFSMILDDDVFLDLFNLDVLFVVSVVDDDFCFLFCDCVEDCLELLLAIIVPPLVDDVAEDIFDNKTF